MGLQDVCVCVRVRVDEDLKNCSVQSEPIHNIRHNAVRRAVTDDYEICIVFENE